MAEIVKQMQSQIWVNKHKSNNLAGSVNKLLHILALSIKYYAYFVVKSPINKGSSNFENSFYN